MIACGAERKRPSPNRPLQRKPRPFSLFTPNRCSLPMALTLLRNLMLLSTAARSSPRKRKKLPKLHQPEPVGVARRSRVRRRSSRSLGQRLRYPFRQLRMNPNCPLTKLRLGQWVTTNQLVQRLPPPQRLRHPRRSARQEARLCLPSDYLGPERPPGIRGVESHRCPATPYGNFCSMIPPSSTIRTSSSAHFVLSCALVLSHACR